MAEKSVCPFVSCSVKPTKTTGRSESWVEQLPALHMGMVWEWHVCQGEAREDVAPDAGFIKALDVRGGDRTDITNAEKEYSEKLTQAYPSPSLYSFS